MPFDTGSSSFWIIIIAILLIYIVIIYNSIVTLKQNINQAFADIDVQLKQRANLVPQLVNIVKGYASHESSLLLNVTEARAKAMSASSLNERVNAEAKFGAAVHGFLGLAEQYPDLKANQNFLSLQSELSDIENKIAASRRFFNNATAEYNTAIMKFPSNFIASIFNFSKSEFFELSEIEKENYSNPPEIKF